MAARLEWGKIDTRFLEERDARQPGCRHASCTLVYARRLNGEAPAGAGQVAGRGGRTIDVDGAGLRPAPVPPEAGPTPRVRLTGDASRGRQGTKRSEREALSRRTNKDSLVGFHELARRATSFLYFK
jgi:hypothetical protein